MRTPHRSTATHFFIAANIVAPFLCYVNSYTNLNVYECMCTYRANEHACTVLTAVFLHALSINSHSILHQIIPSLSLFLCVH